MIVHSRVIMGSLVGMCSTVLIILKVAKEIDSCSYKTPRTWSCQSLTLFWNPQGNSCKVPGIQKTEIIHFPGLELGSLKMNWKKHLKTHFIEINLWHNTTGPVREDNVNRSAEMPRSVVRTWAICDSGGCKLLQERKPRGPALQNWTPALRL